MSFDAVLTTIMTDIPTALLPAFMKLHHTHHTTPLVAYQKELGALPCYRAIAVDHLGPLALRFRVSLAMQSCVRERVLLDLCAREDCDPCSCVPRVHALLGTRCTANQPRMDTDVIDAGAIRLLFRGRVRGRLWLQVGAHKICVYLCVCVCLCLFLSAFSSEWNLF